jgi:hypothetical protein
MELTFIFLEPTQLTDIAVPKDVSNQAEPEVIEPTKKAEKSQPPAEKIVENKRSTHATEEEEIDDVEPGDEDLVEEIFDDEEEEEVGEPRQQVLKNQINKK